jgi:hypothetical protein
VHGRFQPELVVECSFQIAIDLQSVGLASTEIQRTHEEVSHSLMQGVRFNKSAKLIDHLTWSASGNGQAETFLSDFEAELVQSVSLLAHPGFVLEPRQGRPPPQAECRDQFGLRRRRRFGRGAAAPGHVGCEAMDVHRLPRNL